MTNALPLFCGLRRLSFFQSAVWQKFAVCDDSCMLDGNSKWLRPSDLGFNNAKSVKFNSHQSAIVANRKKVAAASSKTSQSSQTAKKWRVSSNVTAKTFEATHRPFPRNASAVCLGSGLPKPHIAGQSAVRPLARKDLRAHENRPPRNIHLSRRPICTSSLSRHILHRLPPPETALAAQAKSMVHTTNRAAIKYACPDSAYRRKKEGNTS